MRTVDVSPKPETFRYAKAYGRISLRPQTVEKIREGKVPKGDVLSACKVAGIMASKRTFELLPFCHPITFDHVEVEVELKEDGLEVFALVSGVAKTGYEMEALTVVLCTLLCVYDMCKGLDDSMVIQSVKVIEKGGGKSWWSAFLEGKRVLVRGPLANEIRAYLEELGALVVSSEDEAHMVVSTEELRIKEHLIALEAVMNAELFKFFPQAIKEGVRIGYKNGRLILCLQPDRNMVELFFRSFGPLLGNYII